MATIIKSSILYGVGEPKPLRGFPDGSLLVINQSPRDWVTVSVTINDKIRLFYVKEDNGYWMPAFEQGRNQTV